MSGKGKFFCFFLLLTFLAVYIPALLAGDPLTAVIWSVAGLCLFLCASEIVIRVVYRVVRGTGVPRFKRVPLETVHTEPHPYRPYAYKKGFPLRPKPETDRQARYPLHQGKYLFPETGFNNYGIRAGLDGQQDVAVPAPEGTYRIVCLGGSTTGNGLEENGKVYTYPTELEKILQERHPSATIEVLNCGVGGYTSADLVTQFMLSIIDTKPDMVVVYHAYNDLGISLTPGFQSDYSHARKSFGESWKLHELRAHFPDLPFALYNLLLNSLFPGDLSQSIISQVSVGKPDIEGEFKGLATYERNLEHIVVACKAQGIDVLCSTFCNYHYPEVSSSSVHAKYAQGVQEENEVMRALAKKHDTLFVDAAERMPDDEACFVDSIHFSSDGMTKLATYFAEEIDGLITAWAKKGSGKEGGC